LPISESAWEKKFAEGLILENKASGWQPKSNALFDSQQYLILKLSRHRLKER
jgi:hypothetical protein